MRFETYLDEETRHCLSHALVDLRCGVLHVKPGTVSLRSIQLKTHPLEQCTNG